MRKKKRFIQLSFAQVIFRLEKEGLNENDKVKLSLPSLNKLQVNFERTIENRLEMKLTKPNSNLRLDVTLPENVICDRTSASVSNSVLLKQKLVLSLFFYLKTGLFTKLMKLPLLNWKKLFFRPCFVISLLDFSDRKEGEYPSFLFFVDLENCIFDLSILFSSCFCQLRLRLHLRILGSPNFNKQTKVRRAYTLGVDRAKQNTY